MKRWTVFSWTVAVLPVLAIVLLAFIGSVRATSFPAIELANGVALGGGGTFNLPLPTGSGGIVAGDLLVVAIAHDSNGGPGSCETGWTFITSASNYVIICARNATGGEIQYPSFVNPSGLIAGQSFRIVGWRMGTINNGVIDASAFRGTGSANPNPPSFNPSGWDVENTLWLAGGAISNSGQAWDITTPPTNFTLVRYDDGTQQSIASAQRNSQAASMDPETFGTTSSGTSWQARKI